MTGWQHHMLADEESNFLREVNEISRTSFLRFKKIHQLLSTIEGAGESMFGNNKSLEKSVQLLISMTLSTLPEEGVFDTEMKTVLHKGEAIIRRIIEYRRKQLVDADGEDALTEPQVTDMTFVTAEIDENESDEQQLGASNASQQGGAEEANANDPRKTTVLAAAPAMLARSGTLAANTDDDDTILLELRSAMDLLDGTMHEVFDAKVLAEVELKDFEDTILASWKQKKHAHEQGKKRWAALTGMRHGLQVAADHHEAFRTKLQQEVETKADGIGAMMGQVDENEDAKVDTENMKDFETDDRLEGHHGNGTMPHVLGDFLQEGASYSVEREEILRRNHVGSRDHGRGCKPCHFQGSLCWKGFSCSFCHICPKPKRKSKHQRDVDKRRQERYRLVKDRLGGQCLGELTKIDENRRTWMILSEELKKHVKEAFAVSDVQQMEHVLGTIAKMQEASDTLRGLVPVSGLAEQPADCLTREEGEMMLATSVSESAEEQADAATRHDPAGAEVSKGPRGHDEMTDTAALHLLPAGTLSSSAPPGTSTGALAEDMDGNAKHETVAGVDVAIRCTGADDVEEKYVRSTNEIFYSPREKGTAGGQSCKDKKGTGTVRQASVTVTTWDGTAQAAGDCPSGVGGGKNRSTRQSPQGNASADRGSCGMNRSRQKGCNKASPAGFSEPSRWQHHGAQHSPPPPTVSPETTFAGHTSRQHCFYENEGREREPEEQNQQHRQQPQQQPPNPQQHYQHDQLWGQPGYVGRQFPGAWQCGTGTARQSMVDEFSDMSWASMGWMASQCHQWHGEATYEATNCGGFNNYQHH
eukprot:TRINITY_DN43097_c0_g1_i1.p1 TRINITY_DN43097_c0_g1~~TRINITY_DN43097_c0_g1_i1.p1  ORF type:complete len:813 (+),score=166.16 TRINITY_DN43097_c0_g1_i1:127-2565(+)